MSKIVDQFGSWTVLGLIYPKTTLWTLFPENAANSEVFRLTFDTNWTYWEQESKYRFKSYGLMQEEYRPLGAGISDPSTTQFSQKIIPQKEQLLVKINFLPFSFVEIQRQLKIKRFYWSSYQNWESTQPTLDIPWSVKIEAMEPNN